MILFLRFSWLELLRLGCIKCGGFFNILAKFAVATFRVHDFGKCSSSPLFTNHIVTPCWCSSVPIMASSLTQCLMCKPYIRAVKPLPKSFTPVMAPARFAKMENPIFNTGLVLKAKTKYNDLHSFYTIYISIIFLLECSKDKHSAKPPFNVSFGSSGHEHKTVEKVKWRKFYIEITGETLIWV